MIKGIAGYSNSSGTNLLLAAYGNDIVNVATGLGYNLNLNPSYDVDFASLQDHLFFQNYYNEMKTFNGTTWGRTHASKTMLGKYLYPWLERMYTANIKIRDTMYASRVWFTNLPKNNILQWDYETQADLQTFANSPVVKSNLAYFKTHGIKRGDPFFILDGNDIGEYTIEEVSHEHQIILTENLTTTATGRTYWVGGNWFDVQPNDGDFITGISENSNNLLIFKRDSLHRYNQTTLVKVEDALGTTSRRSIINKSGLTIYFHGASSLETGFYAYDGTSSRKISAAIERHIQGISSTMFDQIIAWKEGNLYRAYVGDIVNSNYNINVSNAVVTLDLESNVWSIDPISDVIVAATQFRQDNNRDAFLGTDDDEVVQTPVGYSFNTEPVRMTIETHPYFPEGTSVINELSRIQIISESAEGIRVSYKRHLKPFDDDDNPIPLGQIDNKRTEFTIDPEYAMASGYSFQFQNITDKEYSELIKKMTLFYIPKTTNIQ